MNFLSELENIFVEEEQVPEKYLLTLLNEIVQGHQLNFLSTQYIF